MNKVNKNIACAIFAGGQNKRMGGRHKAFLEINGKTFIHTIIDNLKKNFSDIFIITNYKKQFSSLSIPVYEDIIPGKGPIGALHTALSIACKDKIFCMACDMPFLNNKLIEKIICASKKNDCDCFVPKGEKGLEPLFSIYKKELKDIIEKQIQNDKLKLSEIFEKCKPYYIDISKEDAVINVNTEGEYERVKEGQEKDGTI